jgi:hypothetical protein
MDHAELLRSFYEHLLQSDPQVRDRLDELKAYSEEREVRESFAGLSDLEGIDYPDDVAVETIVSRVGRPVLEVRDNDYILSGPETQIWRERLGGDAARRTIGRVIPAVGRIEVQHHRMDWLGTGWLVREDVVVTNRHVAGEFGVRSGQQFVFRSGIDGRPMTARIDFREENGSPDAAEFKVLDILHIEDDGGPDIALLKIERRGSSGSLAEPLRLASRAPSARDYVATIGYPAEDSRIPDQALVLHIFGNIYNKKRLAPGQVQAARSDLVTHDCSTLGGNSGSPLFRLDTGEVVGLHFAGLYLRENRSVPAALIRDRLDRRPPRPIPPDSEDPRPVQPAAVWQQSAQSPDESTWTIPLQVTVKLGQPTLTVGAGSQIAAQSTSMSLASAVEHVRQRVSDRSSVLAVREGYRFRNGWITKEKAVVVLVKGRGAKESAVAELPAELGGQAVEVRVAGPWDYLEAQQALEALEGVPATSYKKPEDFKLEMVDEEMSVVCNVGPDSGWPALEEFLGETRKGLTIGMYELTAPHIIAAVKEAVEDDPRKLTLVLHKGESIGSGTKVNDVPEAETVKKYKRSLKERFKFEWASVGKNRQFASSYHIKVVVRDREAFWISSGSHQSSNQPAEIDHSTWELLQKYNREWHAVVESPELAEQFEKYLQYDYKNARRDADEEARPLPEMFFFVAEPPAIERARPTGRPKYFRAKKFEKRIKVMPLLTPDNYQPEILKLIKSAKESILFQNQTLNVLADDKNDPRFEALLDALLEKQEKGLDVKIIMRGEFDVSGPLERLQERGFDMDRVRLQDRCHNKGIIVDGKVALVSSMNWSNQGVLVNRDAGLLFYDREIAEYYREVFDFDWKNLTRQSVDEAREIVLADEAREAPAHMERMSWEEILMG